MEYLTKNIHQSSHKQQGMATLIVVVILLIVMAVMALMVGRKGLMEQQMTGNDIRAREVQEAAEAGLEFGVSWAATNQILWIGNALDCPGQANCPALPDNIDTSTTGESYTLTQLLYSRPSATSEYVQVTAVANGGGAAGGDDSIEALASMYIKPGGLLSSQGKLPPPLVLDGCMTSTTGTPDIYPSWNDINGDGVRDPNEWVDANDDGIVDAGEWTDSNGNGEVDNEMGEAIMTSQPETVGGNYCLDYCGPGGGNAGCSADANFSHLDLHNGTLNNDEAFPDWDGDGDGSIWEYYFDVSISEYQAVASSTLSTAGGPYYLTGTGNRPGGTYGSLTNPAIIVSENGCPKFNGNTTIYGIVLFLEENGCVSDPMNGWGNVTVYGSVGANGGVHKMNANLEIHGVGSGSGLNVINEIPINASKLPGTWNDFI
jgi:hypothetical protein